MQSMQEKKVLGSELSLHRGPKVGERMAHSRTQKHSRMAGEQQQQSRLPGWALRVFVARSGVAALPPDTLRGFLVWACASWLPL